jgi:hypothetical protein
MKTEEKGFMIVMLAVLVGMTVFSVNFSQGSRMLPLFSGIFSAVLLAFLIAMVFSPKLATWYKRIERKAGEDESVPLTVSERRKELRIFSWFIGGTVLVYLIGFIAAIPLFLFLFLRFSAGERWKMSVLLPAIVTAVLYVTFVVILRVPLEGGVFFQ